MATQPTLPNLPAVPNAPGTGSTVGTLGANPVSLSSGLSLADGAHTLVGDFKDSYGTGTGTALAGVLGNLGTATDKAVVATNQNILNAAGIQQANIRSGDAAHGLSADSSASALALGDFNAQVNSQLQATDANMELQQEDTLISSLQGEGAAHGGDGSFMKSLGAFLQGGGLGVIGDTSTAINSLPGISGGASSALDIIGML